MVYFYLALFVHLICLIIGFGAVIVIDTAGFLWWTKLKQISLKRVTEIAQITQPLIWCGFIGMLISGSFLLYFKGYIDNLTKIKLSLVVMIGLNGVTLHYIKRKLENIIAGVNTEFRLLPIIIAATIISQTGWLGALSIGFLHRHWRGYIHFPENPWIFISIIWAVFSLVSLFIYRRLKVGVSS